MKLNKNGWGFVQMFWMSFIIFFFFLLAIVLIWRLYREMDYKLKDEQVIIEKTRNDMVYDLNIAGETYLDNYYSELEDVNEIKLTDTDLFNRGLFAKDLYGSCRGYVIVSKVNNHKFTKAYIKCDDYKSPGYDNY